MPAFETPPHDSRCRLLTGHGLPLMIDAIAQSLIAFMTDCPRCLRLTMHAAELACRVADHDARQCFARQQ